MKKLFFLFGLTFFLSSCEKEGVLTNVSNQISIIDNAATLKYTGTFVATSGISVNGKVNVYVQSNKYQLQIENIMITDGPDLKVYLSKTDAPSSFVNLGNFKGNGTSVYNIPAQVNVSEYPYVLIHCQQYNHLFAIAQLIPKQSN
ncbi:MAG: DM13 domain-containing protein [Bacteroidota bacterium]